MSLAPESLAAINQAWRSVESRFGAYRLALPGSPTFHCQPDLCDAHCCRAFTVNLSTAEVERLEGASALPRSRFLESVDGEPITLPLAQPYILARTDNHCSLLDSARSCSQYLGRPNACRLYPHFLLFIEPGAGRPIHGDVALFESELVRMRDGLAFERAVPLLVRHIECPGFTGTPMTEDAWIELIEATFALQFEYVE